MVPTGLDAAVPQTKNIAVLGSTGSIGCQTLEVARQEGYRVVALAAGRNVALLARQIAEFGPRFVSVIDESAKEALMALLSAQERGGFLNPSIGIGRRGAIMAATHPDADTVVAAITGFAGLEPVLGAASAGKKIALANKESLVVAGEEVKRLAAESG
ncbi:MAG TPA: 1-deoxy-D-xylulose-5-phosphate reductoisomerase, partial [Clostridia bacterium]|nr:1-deoxy-D-xylulose-5-phosphate reductoisomerase [Clostridia bacterium]